MTNSSAAARPVLPPPVAPAWWQDFTARLAALATAAGAVDPATARAARALAERLGRPRVVITFGGYFSAGKSSLLNCALGRPLLPVDDLPETGAPCLMSAGPRDEAALVTADGRRTAMLCNRDAIRKAIGLWGQSGANAAAADAVRLELRLAGFPAPAGVTWVDAPGIASGAETRHAEAAAEAADVLVWVLKGSGQFLSEAECEAVAAHVERHGAASVVFVINAFLPRDRADDWARFLADRLPVHEQRLRDRLALLGLSGRQVPLAVVSARAAGSSPREFGGLELRRLLSALGTPDAPIVRRARLGRAAAELRRLADALAPRLTALAAENAERRRRAEAERDDAERRRSRFLTEAEQALDRFLVALAVAASERAEAVAAPITADNLKRDDTYGRELSKALQRDAASAFAKLRAELKEAARAARQGSPSGLSRLEKLLLPDSVEVAVPDAAIGKGGVAAGAAAGAVVGSVVPVIGTFLGALAGAAAGAGLQARAAVAKDVEGAKANVRAAASAAAAEVRGRRRRALKRIEEMCDTDASSVPPPDHAAEKRLRDVTGALSALAAAAGGQS